MSHQIPCNMHVIMTGITPCLKSPQFLTLGTHIKICILSMLIAQNLQEVPVNFTGISPKIMLLEGEQKKVHKRFLSLEAIS